MTSVGDVLRKAREQQERTIAEIAEELCVTQSYVRAIENDDLKNLPGIFFYKSFTRQYAAVVGVEESAIAQGMASLTAVEEVAQPQNGAKPAPLFPLDPIVEFTNRSYFSEHPLGISIAGLVAAIALCSGFYAWWSRAPQTTAPVAQSSSTTSSQTVTQATTEVVAVSATPSTDEDATTTVAVADDSDLKEVVLSLSATEKTWLKITSDGRTIFSGILQPSESKVLKGSDMATMKVGNAAGIDVRLNGKPIGPLGTRGQVRTVRFTHENFEILPPADGSEPSNDPKTL